MVKHEYKEQDYVLLHKYSLIATNEYKGHNSVIRQMNNE